MFKVERYISINSVKALVDIRRQHTVGKDNIVRLLSSIPLKGIFNVRLRRANFKLCTYKDCSIYMRTPRTRILQPYSPSFVISLLHYPLRHSAKKILINQQHSENIKMNAKYHFSENEVSCHITEWNENSKRPFTDDTGDLIMDLNCNELGETNITATPMLSFLLDNLG